jgi:hypothetical protein
MLNVRFRDRSHLRSAEEVVAAIATRAPVRSHNDRRKIQSSKINHLELEFLAQLNAQLPAQREQEYSDRAWLRAAIDGFRSPQKRRQSA